MSILVDVYSYLKEETKKVQKTSMELEQVEADIKSGRYSRETVQKELWPKRDSLKRRLEGEIAEVDRGARKLVKDYQDELRAQDELKPEELTADLQLLNSGISLSARDINAILKRNPGNRTMSQLALRYARDHEIDMGGAFYVGNEEEIKAAESINSAIHLYTDHWISRPEAGTILGKFFGVTEDDG